ncbi:hypothetical protein SHIRM173S_11830 [Streptomyces hirsutus]
MCPEPRAVRWGITPGVSDDHTRVLEFVTARAAAWDRRFPDDGPAYAGVRWPSWGCARAPGCSTPAAAPDGPCRRCTAVSQPGRSSAQI